jgi:O-antigen biosynthesis protein WbqP
VVDQGVTERDPAATPAASSVPQQQRPHWTGKRLLDVVLVLLASPFTLPLAGVIAVAIKLDSPGPALHWSDRIGRFNRIFRMPKFRTMYVNTPQLPTHLLANGAGYVTRVGRFLRSSSLDELPQLWSVLQGDLTLVGPRPALFNQDDLKELRTAAGVQNLVPGVTGWAQINGRDDLPIPVKVQFDIEYLQRQSFSFDMKILLLTFVKVLRREGVHH